MRNKDRLYGSTNKAGAKRPKEPGTPLLRWKEERRVWATPPQKELPTVGLFAGIGGIELGLERAGHRSLLLCENDPGAIAVLEDRFPRVRLRHDVREVRSLPSETELLTAGFPCQDLSQAGLTGGIDGDQSGLVGEVFRLLSRKRVTWVLLENVPFMLSLGRGRALDVIIQALERLGYRWAYRVVDARAFGLPQRRERVFLLASRYHDPRDVLLADEAGPPDQPDPSTVACGFYWTEGLRGLGWAVDAVPTLKGGSTVGIPSPPAILLPDGQIIQPDIRDAERLQGFRADWTRPAERAVRSSLRWKLVGNAVSVRVANWIGRRLAEPQEYDGSWDEPLAPGRPWPRAAWSIGRGRFVSARSSWPVSRQLEPLAEFLQFEGRPLSRKAALGFRSRTRKSRLRFPQGFLEAIDAHIAGMSDSEGDELPGSREPKHRRGAKRARNGPADIGPTRPRSPERH